MKLIDVGYIIYHELPNTNKPSLTPLSATPHH